MRTSLTKLLLTSCLPLSASLALATDYDFQGLTAGSASSGSGITVFNSSSVVNVADATTSPADAFGGTGNKSLYLSSTASGGAQAQLNLSASAITSGTLSFDLYVIGTGTTPGLIEIDLGTPNSGSSNSQRSASIAALQVWTNSATTTDSSLSPAGKFLGFMGGISGGSNLYTFNQTVLIGAKNTISISWDANANTYSVMLNGATVTQGTGPSITSTFTQTTEQNGVTAVRFTSSNASSTSYFIDNISVVSSIPEPSTTASLLGAAVGFVTLSNRRFGIRRHQNMQPQG